MYVNHFRSDTEWALQTVVVIIIRLLRVSAMSPRLKESPGTQLQIYFFAELLPRAHTQSVHHRSVRPEESLHLPISQMGIPRPREGKRKSWPRPSCEMVAEPGAGAQIPELFLLAPLVVHILYQLLLLHNKYHQN